jgi:hypothetical protein
MASRKSAVDVKSTDELQHAVASELNSAVEPDDEQAKRILHENTRGVYGGTSNTDNSGSVETPES